MDKKVGDTFKTAGDFFKNENVWYMILSSSPYSSDWSGGFLYVDDLLQSKHFLGVDTETIKSIVENCNKQRFSLENDTDTGRLKIRANQGHSLQVSFKQHILLQWNEFKNKNDIMFNCWQSVFLIAALFLL